MSIQDEAVKTAMVRFGLVKEASPPVFLREFLAGKGTGQMINRLGAYYGATRGAGAGGLLGAGIGAATGAMQAQPGEGWSGALKGGLTGGAMGAATGGVAGGFGGRALARSGWRSAAQLANAVGGVQAAKGLGDYAHAMRALLQSTG